MRTFITLVLLVGLAVAIGSYAHWCQQRPHGHYLSDLRSQVALDHGKPGRQGNLLGIQPELFPADYQSLQRLRLKLAAYLDKARELGLLNERTIVVLPEHIGTWLLAVGEKAELYDARDQQQALRWLAASNPLAFLGALAQADDEQRWQDALLRTKAETMARDYQQLFGELAREYSITLVAGSIVLPEPRVELGQLLPGSGPLYNVSLVFDQAGQPIGQPQRQVLTSGAISASPSNLLQVLDTPAGRLGVLVGGDAGELTSQRELNRQQVELLAIPGDPGQAQGALNEWINSSNIRAGVAVSLRGRLWEQSSQRQALAIDAGQPLLGSADAGAQLINLWL